MRIKKEQADLLMDLIRRNLPGAEVYLFGSRANDQRKGGDTDILVVGKRVLTHKERRAILIAFKKQFGPQKIDIVSYHENDKSTFKELALLEAKPL
jgi:predicted nucleotidyltransferase